MPNTNAIRAALDTYLLATSPTLPPVAFGNVRFDQTLSANATYLQAQFAPISRRAATRGPNPQYRHAGIYLVTVCTPEEIGSGDGMTLVDRLLDRFRVDTPILGVDVNVTIEYSEPETGFHRPPFDGQPVRIGWYCYA
jgi:hypothetical protein